MAISVIVLGAALAALAQAAPAPGHPVSAESFVRRADANGDGRVSREEWRADTWKVHIAQWGEAEARGIPVSNVVSAMCHGNPQCLKDGGASMYARTIDRNHDGFIDRQESDANSENLFRANDVNHDGYVTLEEMNAVASKPPPK
jgi:hypothetical protein